MKTYSLIKKLQTPLFGAQHVNSQHHPLALELGNPRLTHAARLDLLHAAASSDQQVYVTPKLDLLNGTWSYVMGLESRTPGRNEKSQLLQSGVMRDEFVNSYAVFCAEVVARKQAAFLQENADLFGLSKMVNTCVGTMTDAPDRAALAKALDDPRYCAANFGRIEVLPKPDDRFVAHFKSNPALAQPDLQLHFSNRGRSMGEFRGDVLQHALSSGGYGSLRELVEARHLTQEDPGLCQVSGLMKRDFSDLVTQRALSPMDRQLVIEALDKHPSGTTSIGQMWFPAPEFARSSSAAAPQKSAQAAEPFAFEHNSRRSRVKSALAGAFKLNRNMKSDLPDSARPSRGQPVLISVKPLP